MYTRTEQNIPHLCVEEKLANLLQVAQNYMVRDIGAKFSREILHTNRGYNNQDGHYPPSWIFRVTPNQ